MQDQFDTAFILLPRLDSIRYHLIQARVQIAQIERQATIYQPYIRRLCGEADYHLTHNVDALRSIIEYTRHNHDVKPNGS